MRALTGSETIDLQQDFFSFLEASGFPCVGAKSALATGMIATLQARDLSSAWDDLNIHRRLCTFGEEVKAAGGKGFRSFAVLFDAPRKLSETEFERAMWIRLQSLRDKDRWLSYRGDPRVSHDPASPEFAFSIGGEGYFVVGMHPGSSRRSRRTPMPVLVFNPFSQFEQLREDGRYDRMSEVVRRRDEVACGSPNPMLQHHGEDSAAKQFSGRAVDDRWVCPLDQAAAWMMAL